MSENNLLRYQRQTSLPEFGEQGQLRLQNARVLIVGIGGLGCPVANYLVAAGVGGVTLIDHDRVELSNLQRQVLFAERDIGLFKVNVAKQRLLMLNSACHIHIVTEKLTKNNVEQLIEQHDIVVDCTDSLLTQYILNDYCYWANKPLVTASILQFRAQAAIYFGKRYPCMRCAFPAKREMPLPDCQSAGVLGAVVGMVGCWQALETIKWLVNQGGSNALGKLFSINCEDYQWQHYVLSQDPGCGLCGQDPHAELVYPEAKKLCKSYLINMDQVKEKMKKDPLVQLIDVREPAEHIEKNIGGINIPLDNLSKHAKNLNKQDKYILYCRSGRRSQQGVLVLLKLGFKQVFSIEHGIAG